MGTMIRDTGKAYEINRTTSGEIVATPGAGQRLVLCGFLLSVDADETVELRWDGPTGDIIVPLPTKGAIGMTPVAELSEAPVNCNLYLTKSGSGNARGTVWIKVRGG